VDFHYRGEWDGERWGNAVAAGDLNQDGIGDLVAMHARAATMDGAVYVYFGRATPYPTGTPTTTADLIITGPAGAAVQFGRGVARR
jgi:hypothetical protein